MLVGIAYDPFWQLYNSFLWAPWMLIYFYIHFSCEYLLNAWKFRFESISESSNQQYISKYMYLDTTMYFRVGLEMLLVYIFFYVS